MTVNNKLLEESVAAGNVAEFTAFVFFCMLKMTKTRDMTTAIPDTISAIATNVEKSLLLIPISNFALS